MGLELGSANDWVKEMDDAFLSRRHSSATGEGVGEAAEVKSQHGTGSRRDDGVNQVPGKKAADGTGEDLNRDNEDEDDEMEDVPTG
nr:uncharacterized protein BN887_00166 [Melanopsichium pennsylvanicum 4]